ncbi:hypothetical protein CsatA_011791 [Cannabis sativa]
MAYNSSTPLPSNSSSDEGGIFIPSEESVLQKHVAFFDRNHDGIVYPWETFQGFRAIGCGLTLSTIAAIFINMGLSQKTRHGNFSLLFPIDIKNIHKAVHSSDSGVYDSNGRFVPLKFDEMFKKYAHTHPNALTSDEVMALLKGNRVPKDYKGWVAAWTEWKILYILCKDKKGLLHKETVRGVYDGSLFERLEKEHSSKNKKHCEPVV